MINEDFVERTSPNQQPVAILLHPPANLNAQIGVLQGVMLGAQVSQIRNFCGTALCPLDGVIDLARVNRTVTSRGNCGELSRGDCVDRSVALEIGSAVCRNGQ